MQQTNDQYLGIWNHYPVQHDIVNGDIALFLFKIDQLKIFAHTHRCKFGTTGFLFANWEVWWSEEIVYGYISNRNGILILWKEFCHIWF